MKIIDNFLEKVEEDKASIAYLKAKTLSVILVITAFLIFSLMVKNIITESYKEVFVGVIIIILITGVLFIIKKGKVILAGSVITLAILIIESISMFNNLDTSIIPYQFYVFFIVIIERLI